MDFIKSLFNSKKIACPRCLGKGEVDQSDLKRLDRELFWGIGPCAYCNGLGLVPTDMPEKVDPAMPYLTTSLTQQERNLLIRGDASALARAENYDFESRQFISEVEYLRFVGNMDAEKIVGFYLRSDREADTDTYRELLIYVQKIIAHYKG